MSEEEEHDDEVVDIMSQPIQFDYDTFVRETMKLLEGFKFLFNVLFNQLDSDASENEGGDEPPTEENSMSIEEIVSQMDHELSSTKVGKSFSNNDKDGNVDIDVNLMQNLLESFDAQQGLSGPMSNIIGSLGMDLPKRNKI